MSYIVYKQPTVTWSPPKLDPDGEVDVGEEIARVGKSQYYMSFWRSLSKSNSQDGPPPSAWRILAMALVGLFVLGLVMLGSVLMAKTAPLLASIASLVGLMLFIYMVTLLIAFLRYAYWVARMLRRFHKNPPENTKEVRDERRAAKRKADAEVNDMMFKWAVQNHPELRKMYKPKSDPQA